MATATARLGKKRGELELEGVVTSADLAAAIDRLASRWNEKDEITTAADGVSLDGSGNGHIKLYKVPPGYEAQVYFICAEAGGYSWGTPYTGSAGAALTLNRNSSSFGNLLDGSQGLTILPYIFSYGSDARILRSGDELRVYVTGGPAFGQVIASMQAVLRPTVTP